MNVWNKKIMKSAVWVSVFSTSLPLYASSGVRCPSLDELDVSHFSMSDVHYAGPSDNPSEWPYSWYGYFQQMMTNQQSWYVAVGYAVQKKLDKRKAYHELMTLYPDLVNRHPVMADDNGVCIYRLSPNGKSGYAMNYVAGCLAGAACSADMSHFPLHLK